MPVLLLGACAFTECFTKMSTEDELPTFFTLPNTACVNTLRFFSDYPSRRNWVVHLSSAVLVDVADKNHPLRDAAREAVTQLALISVEDEPTLRKIVEMYGARCLELTWNGELEHDFSRNRACTSLKKLQVLYGIRLVDDTLISLLSVQRNLEEVGLHNSSVVGIEGETFREAMQRRQKDYTKVVKCLTDLGDGLKRLDIPIYLAEGEAYSRMFNVLGSTLESLKLNIHEDAGEDTLEPASLRFNLFTFSAPSAKTICARSCLHAQMQRLTWSCP